MYMQDSLIVIKAVHLKMKFQPKVTKQNYKRTQRAYGKITKHCDSSGTQDVRT